VNASFSISRLHAHAMLPDFSQPPNSIALPIASAGYSLDNILYLTLTLLRRSVSYVSQQPQQPPPPQYRKAASAEPECKHALSSTA